MARFTAIDLDVASFAEWGKVGSRQLPVERKHKMKFKLECYTCELLGAAYNCPALKLYGYGTERKLVYAIKRKVSQIKGQGYNAK